MMPDAGSFDAIDAIANAVAARLAARMPAAPGLPGLPGGPAGEPDLELPPNFDRAQLNRPGGLLPTRHLAITTIELTQSTQHCNAGGTGYGGDNSVPLVALKRLVARVYPYVSSGMQWPDSLIGARVTGELVLSVGNRIAYRTGPTREDGARVGRVTDLDRTLWDAERNAVYTTPDRTALVMRQWNPPLNFVVPAYYCRRGRATVSVRLWRILDDGSASTRDTAAAAESLEFIDVPAPRVALVRVNWTDGAGNTTGPSDAAMLDTLRIGERMLPFPYFDTTILGLETTTGAAFASAADAPGGCNAAWDRLVADLAVTRIFTSLFGLGDIVFGFVSTAALPPSAKNVVVGCGRTAGASIVGLDKPFAHEMGHLYGRPHTAVPGDASSDPDYPRYGSRRTSIGEVGIDTGTSPPTVYSPYSSDDIMSYGDDLWISPYTYEKILEARDRHQASPADPARVRTILIISARLHRAGEVELRTALKVEAAGRVPRIHEQAISPMSVDILDANNRILATRHCLYVPSHGGGDCCCDGGSGRVPLDREPWLDVNEAIDWPDDAFRLSFHRNGESIATFDRGEAPSVEISEPDFTEQDGAIVVRVLAEHPRQTPSVVVMYTPDDGMTWQPVAIDPPNGEVAVLVDRLAGGDSCRFRAIATAELESAIADTGPFVLPVQGRRLYPVLPSGDCAIRAGAVSLIALVDNRGHDRPTPDEVRWRSSLQGELGFGLDVVAELGAGRHVITVTAPDGLGHTIEERGIIIVGG